MQSQDALSNIPKQNYAGEPQSTCPNCGYCPHCGRGGYLAIPIYPQYPTWPPYYPYVGDAQWYQQPVTWTTTTGNLQGNSSIPGLSS